jgi:hypothetical protein
VIAFIGDAPPVYNPGGRPCQIDDFAAEPGRWNSAGTQLLRAAIEQAKGRGAIQAVVVPPTAAGCWVITRTSPYLARDQDQAARGWSTARTGLIRRG